jgi:hypothetical protein
MQFALPVPLQARQSSVSGWPTPSRKANLPVPSQRTRHRARIGHVAPGTCHELPGEVGHKGALTSDFGLARLEGLEPPTGCLEDIPWLYGNFRGLQFVALDVHQDALAAKLVGVG